ncbi:MAG: hypothetical protein J7518_09260 [Nocardioidaceae bacterium]|nr:hypothetical protein [Nocardioidaceae bacterium]
MSTPDVLLVTCRALPEGEPGAAVLDEALAARGITASWVAWDDDAVDWAGSLVAVRAAWDYDARREEFLAWARSVPRLLNSAAIFAWNTDKAYLAALAEAGAPVVPTYVVEGAAVVKPRVGAGGRGVQVLDSVVVQPLVESIRTEGEYSVYVLGGEVVSMAVKRPAAGEIRVHEQYGGRTVALPVTEEAAAVARSAVRAAEQLLGERLDYARVDQLRLADGTLAVSELEVTEPGLYLEEIPGNGPAFAALVAALLGR